MGPLSGVLAVFFDPAIWGLALLIAVVLVLVEVLRMVKTKRRVK